MMSRTELLERSRKALAALNALPVDEQWRRLIAYGTINERGEVLYGRDATKATPSGDEKFR